jgi:hypothetical protein
VEQAVHGSKGGEAAREAGLTVEQAAAEAVAALRREERHTA